MEWSPQGTIAASNLLYTSLLMSLLVAFVAMPDKRWFNRYLQHASGSVIRCCGNPRPRGIAVPVVHRVSPPCTRSSFLPAARHDTCGRLIRPSSRHFLYHSRNRLLCRDCDCQNMLLWVSVPNAGIGCSLASQRQRDNPEKTM